MLGFRRFFTPASADRGDYDALPLSDLQPPSSPSPSHRERPWPPPGLRKERSPASAAALTLRTVGFTVLATTLVFATFIFVFSHFSADTATPISSLTSIIGQHGAKQTVSLSGAGGFYRDPHPIRTMLKYWEIAEREVAEKGLDTCKGQLSRELIDAYVRSAIDYCHPSVRPFSPPNSFVQGG